MVEDWLTVSTQRLLFDPKKGEIILTLESIMDKLISDLKIREIYIVAAGIWKEKRKEVVSNTDICRGIGDKFKTVDIWYKVININFDNLLYLNHL